MSLGYLLVRLDGSNTETRAGIAARLAERHRARLRGIYVVKPASVPRAAVPAARAAGGGFGGPASSAYDFRMPGQAVPDTSATHAPDAFEAAEQQANQAERAFRRAIENAGVEGDFASLRVGREPLWKILLEEALCCDLALVGKPDDADADERKALHRVLCESGGPVLLLPASVDTIGQEQVFVAWNGTREAARAVRAATPLIDVASKVTIVMLRPSTECEVTAKRLEAMIGARGIECTTTADRNPALKVSEALISRADSADLLVAGAYGRSRVTEILTGGTTRRLVEQATLPVLMAH